MLRIFNSFCILEIRSVDRWMKFFPSSMAKVVLLSFLFPARVSHTNHDFFYDVNVSEKFFFVSLACAHLFTQSLRSSTGVWLVRKYSVWIGGSILCCDATSVQALARGRELEQWQHCECAKNAFVAQQAEQDSRQILS